MPRGYIKSASKVRNFARMILEFEAGKADTCQTSLKLNLGSGSRLCHNSWLKEINACQYADQEQAAKTMQNLIADAAGMIGFICKR